MKVIENERSEYKGQFVDYDKIYMDRMSKMKELQQDYNTVDHDL